MIKEPVLLLLVFHNKAAIFDTLISEWPLNLWIYSDEKWGADIGKFVEMLEGKKNQVLQVAHGSGP